MDTGKPGIYPEFWVEKYSDYLYNYAITRIYDKETAHDLVQDTFLAGLAAMKEFKGESSEKTWLISILKRKIIDYYRKASRKREKNIIDHDAHYKLPFVDEGKNKGHWLTDRAPQNWSESVIGKMENEELQKIIDLCVSLLPKKWAAIFTLKIMEEISSEKICKELDISSSNFWVILHRARLKLRECIEDKW
ncbi:MAG: sigma-70 family RNA polymerase sigma factor [Bacteroidales bacterium]|nr:sigma-70 family RNA polymerase sigma factor [Bacteroidales bacterium]